MAWEPGRRSDRKGSFQRPLMVRGGRGREQGRDPKSTGGDGEAAPYLAQVCSMFQALSLLSGCRSPGGGHSPGRYQALPRSLQRKKPESLPPPQLLLALAPEEDRDLLSAFWRERADRPRPRPRLTVRPAPGRDCSREVAERCCCGRAQAPGTLAPSLRRDWLARADPHQLSCQPRVSRGGAPCNPGPAQVTRRGTHPLASTASLADSEE